MPTARSTDAPYVSPLIVIHGRRQIGTNAVRLHAAPAAARSGPARGRPDRARPARRPPPSASSTDRTASTSSSSPAAASAVGVLAAVLLLVDHHEVGSEGDDRGDVGVLGAADVGQVGLLAEPGAGDDVGAEREQGLGGRRDQADDPRCRHAAVSPAACASGPRTRPRSACPAAACPPASPAGWRRRWSPRPARPPYMLVLVGVHLLVDGVGDAVGVLTSVKRCWPLLGARLDQQVAGAEDALEDRPG